MPWIITLNIHEKTFCRASLRILSILLVKNKIRHKKEAILNFLETFLTYIYINIESKMKGIYFYLWAFSLTAFIPVRKDPRDGEPIVSLVSIDRFHIILLNYS